MKLLSMETLNTLLNQFDTWKTLMVAYQRYLILGVLAFALLNCFFGYTLRKLWSILLCFGGGALGGLAVCLYTGQPAKRTLMIAAAIGILCALIGFFLYRLGLFFLIIGLVVFCLWHIVQPSDLFGNLLIGLVAFVIGLLTVPLERLSVILVTSICGAVTTMEMAYLLKGITPNRIMWMISAVLALTGFLFQQKPWKQDEDWEDEEDHENHRKHHPRHQKKIRKNRRKTSSSHRHRVSEDTYDFRFIPEEDEEEAEAELEEELADNSPKTAKKSRKPLPNSRSNRPGQLSADPKTRSIPSEDATVDLSDIRQQISAEVQQIFEENQEKERS